MVAKFHLNTCVDSESGKFNICIKHLGRVSEWLLISACKTGVNSLNPVWVGNVSPH